MDAGCFAKTMYYFSKSYAGRNALIQANAAPALVLIANKENTPFGRELFARTMYHLSSTDVGRHALIAESAITVLASMSTKENTPLDRKLLLFYCF